MYGGSCFAIKGKSSVAIISDLRLGKQSITINKDFSKIYPVNNKTFLGLTLFNPDCNEIAKKMKLNAKLFELKENKKIDPREISYYLSNFLYKKRFQPYFCNPIVCGIKRDGEPYVAGMDQIGCLDENAPFVAAGSAENSLIGVAEGLYREDMDDEELFIVASQIFLNSIDRDALSGWGAECYLINKDKVVVRRIRGRQD